MIVEDITMRYRGVLVFFCPFLSLEGVADSEVKAKAVFELRYIVVAAFSCVVWCVQGNSQIESDNQKRQVIT